MREFRLYAGLAVFIIAIAILSRMLHSDPEGMSGKNNTSIKTTENEGMPEETAIEVDGISYNKALNERNKGHIDLALEYLNDVIENYPDGKYYSSACYEASRIYDARGDTKNALLYANKAVDVSNDVSNPDKVADKALYIIAKKQIKNNQFESALNTCKKIISEYPYSDHIADVIRLRDELNVKLIFSSEECSYVENYTVVPGDSLYKIAKKFRTTVDLIKAINNLKSDTINVGVKLRVPSLDFSILADKSQKTLFLICENEIFKSYKIAVGRNGITPIGEFEIINKLKDPVWYNNGRAVPSGNPENILGVRWMGIDKNGYGIHGTTDETEITGQTTSGCIRMTNNEVAELYDLVVEGVPVTIVE